MVVQQTTSAAYLSALRGPTMFPWCFSRKAKEESGDMAGM